MSILQEILKWSQNLPAWQSDAIARLFVQEALAAKDLEDLFALLKAEHGIPDPKGREANRLSADQIPAVPKPDIQVKLLAMRDLQHVNAIAANQRLPFGSTGLSVIYGDNGSGKSGYSRVLKRACRARDQSEPIHPNAFLPLNEADKAKAMFEVEVNGKRECIAWEDGKPGAALLSSFAVFDSRCARSYLDQEGDFAYVPYGLDIPEGLADVCKKLKGMIDTEYEQSAADRTAFADLAGDTAVGKLVAGLSHKTKPEQVSALATLRSDEVAKHNELSKSLKEGNPKEKAAQLRRQANRITKVAQNAVDKLAVVDDAVVAKLRKLVDANDTTSKAARLAAQQFKEKENLLPGTGGEAWRELFETARRFAIEAYPKKTFPDLGGDSQCLLCQQPLGEEGAGRLLRFEEFVQQEAEKAAKISKKDLSREYDIFAGQNVSLGADEELYAELEALNKELALDTRRFEAALASRHTAMKAVVKSREWDKVKDVPASSAARLQAVADQLNQQAETLDKMTDEKARAAVQTEFNELDARMRLATVKAAVLKAVEQLDRQEKLNKCQSAVKTTAISKKASELTEKVVSKDLEKAINREFKSLGAENLRVCLKSRTDKGKAFHKLKLDLPHAKTPSAILSEGEQRAIAIGSFLAEVNISGSSTGMIFDDPVSSLDHKRRERVARRLAQEASKRQVIILTHDLYFLNLLVDEAQKAGVPVETQSMTRRPEGPGVSDPDLPFEGMNTKARVGYLRNRHQFIEKAYKSGDDLDHRKLTAEAYLQLRIAWERAIEEVLLRNVVLRFRKGIESQRLAGVSVEDKDYTSVDRWMSKCSNYAHDQALMGGVEVPDPDELLSDINALDEWRKQINQRGEHIQKKRKSVR